LEEVDAAPTAAALAALRDTQREFDSLTARWTTTTGPELAALNAKLRSAGQQPVSISPE
jgi:hypothetical protein